MKYVQEHLLAYSYNVRSQPEQLTNYFFKYFLRRLPTVRLGDEQSFYLALS